MVYLCLLHFDQSFSFNDIEKSYKLLLSNLIEEIKNFQNVFKSQNNKKFMMKSTQESLKIVDKKTLIKLFIFEKILRNDFRTIRKISRNNNFQRHNNLH